MNFIAIIPARFFSKRLPGKPLADINGKPMVVHVMEKAQASGADRVIVATDYPQVVEIVKRAGGEACLTHIGHQSGTERIREVIDKYNFSDDIIIVNVQGDEPLIPPDIIRKASENLIDTDANITTLAAPFLTKKEIYNPNIVKVVINSKNYALYFLRSIILSNEADFVCKHKDSLCGLLRHVGIYSYYAGFIRKYVNWSVSPIEKIELLEQLRVLWNQEKIYVGVIHAVSSIGVDTPQELLTARLLAKKNYQQN